MLTISWFIRDLKQIGKVKKLDKWLPRELNANQKKIVILKCHLLLFYATTRNHLSIELSRVMKSGISAATSDDQLSDWAEKKIKSTS